MGLRLLDGIDMNKFEKRFRVSLNDLYEKELDELLDQDLIELTGSNLKLSNKGLFLANEVFERFV